MVVKRNPDLPKIDKKKHLFRPSVVKRAVGGGQAVPSSPKLLPQNPAVIPPVASVPVASTPAPVTPQPATNPVTAADLELPAKE